MIRLAIWLVALYVVLWMSAQLLVYGGMLVWLVSILQHGG